MGLDPSPPPLERERGGESGRLLSRERAGAIALALSLFRSRYRSLSFALATALSLALATALALSLSFSLSFSLLLSLNPPAPTNHVKLFKGWPRGDAPSKVVQLWYK